VEIRSHLLALLAPTAIGDELAAGVILRGVSSEAGPRFQFEVGGERIEVAVAKSDEPGPAAARSARLRFSYRGQSDAGLRVCREVAARAVHNEGAVLDALAREAGDAAGADDARVREIEVRALLEVGPAAGHYTLSPYVGCLIGCRFCYAQEGIARSRRLGGRVTPPWGSFVDVRVNAAAVLAGELVRLRPALIQFCPLVSDPYHAIEARYRLTRACLETIAASASPPPVLLLTRAHAIVEDAALIARIPGSVAGVSLPTLDDDVRRHFEPRGASVAERLDALAVLRAAGVRTAAVVQPLLPGPIDALADALAADADSVRIDVLHGEYGAGAAFDDLRFGAARADGWQRERAAALAGALTARAVPLWPGDLPPEIQAGIARSSSVP
jgi:DNA repair photolyase